MQLRKKPKKHQTLENQHIFHSKEEKSLIKEESNENKI